MAGDFFESASITVALAMASGITAQAIAKHARIPGIVILLAVGVLLGPDAANVVRPNTMGAGLQNLVGFAVAIILFEGGLNLRIGHLRRQAVPIRRLVTVGAVVTAAGGAILAKLVMGWGWRLSVLFGTLVIVTGPTVITPLVRRLRLVQRVATILEAEGIFIDAVGATIAVVALEVALTPNATALGLAVPDIALRIVGGALIGAAGGGLLAVLLRWRHVIPKGMENTLTLAFSVAIFQISNGILHESGITAAIVAGFVVGNARSHALEEIVEFKEQLTVLLIATLFVLLAADVRVSDVMALGWRGVVTVLLLMVVVRPLSVLASTYQTEVTRNEGLFLSWLAPRGIVAAAVASLFAIDLGAAGIAGGVPMRALVFLVIAMTVTIQGLSGGILAQALGLRRASNLGFLFLGANPLARLMGTLLQGAGKSVAFIDANPEACNVAEAEGFKVFHGNGLDERLLTRAQAESRSAVVGLTANESVNMLFARHIAEHFYGPRIFVALESSEQGVTADMVDTHDAKILFGSEVQLSWWATAIEHDRSTVERWTKATSQDEQPTFADLQSRQLLPLVVRTKKDLVLPNHGSKLKIGDEVHFVISNDYRSDAYEWLRSRGFVPRAEVGAAPSSLASDGGNGASRRAASADERVAESQ